ncbi:Serine protease HP21 [Operophtera brumata]|uniref:Serine protease HP21 n=1 Tax=Operophtera brumata TaxID=104452 RepID=A0A0L7KG86_OPEBR|nr:Serine protease HP21 [Operophtera brumata]
MDRDSPETSPCKWAERRDSANVGCSWAMYSPRNCSSRPRDATGDAGSPLQVMNKKISCMYTVIGVISLGSKDCNVPGFPDVFTRVSHYLPWIESIVWPN